MSRQLEHAAEVKEANRNQAVVRALDYGFVGALEAQGIELLGFAFRYNAYDSLMTIKAVVGGQQQVCFVGSESLAGCILKAQSDARGDRLKWRPDKYASSGD